MKRFILFSLIILALSTVAALVVQDTVVLSFAGAFLIAFTAVVVDLLTMGLRRRARRTPLPALQAQGQVEPEESAAEEPSADYLWGIPPISEVDQTSWVTPALPESQEQVAEPAPASTSDFLGCSVGPYQVTARIGEGGTATVYRAFHPALDRTVAIKVLAGVLTATPEMAGRFRREAQTVAALRHPNIVQVYDFGPLGDGHYLAMEYVEGSDLQIEMARRQEEGRPFTPDEILTLLDQIAAALDYAHGLGVVHRDVKPGNILLDAAGRPVLTDFGLATLRRTRATLITTIGRNVLGTPEYTAPEQALDAGDAGPQSDVYSLGCIAYELVSGRLPFEAESPLSIALMHISEEPARPSQHAPDLPSAVDAVILRALAKKPEARFSTAGDLVRALRRAWEERP